MFDTIGKGLHYPVKPGVGGSEAVAGEARIRSNLRFLLSLKFNTVPGMEDVGSELPEVLFEKLEDTLFVKESVLKLVSAFEPRVATKVLEIYTDGKNFSVDYQYLIKGAKITGDIEMNNEDG